MSRWNAARTRDEHGIREEGRRRGEDLEKYHGGPQDQALSKNSGQSGPLPDGYRALPDASGFT